MFYNPLLASIFQLMSFRLQRVPCVLCIVMRRRHIIRYCRLYLRILRMCQDFIEEGHKVQWALYVLRSKGSVSRDKLKSDFKSN